MASTAVHGEAAACRLNGPRSAACVARTIPLLWSCPPALLLSCHPRYCACFVWQYFRVRAVVAVPACATVYIYYSQTYFKCSDSVRKCCVLLSPDAVRYTSKAMVLHSADSAAASNSSSGASSLELRAQKPRFVRDASSGHVRVTTVLRIPQVSLPASVARAGDAVATAAALITTADAVERAMTGAVFSVSVVSAAAAAVVVVVVVVVAADHSWWLVLPLSERDAKALRLVRTCADFGRTVFRWLVYNQLCVGVTRRNLQPSCESPRAQVLSPVLRRICDGPWLFFFVLFVHTVVHIPQQQSTSDRLFPRLPSLTCHAPSSLHKLLFSSAWLPSGASALPAVPVTHDDRARAWRELVRLHWPALELPPCRAPQRLRARWGQLG